MGLTRTDFYTDQQNRMAALAKVIGHPARVAILQHLMKVQTCICGDIVDEIGLSQPTISQHLREMKNIGLITGRIEGTTVCYCIDPTIYNEVKNMFNTLFGQNLSADSGCC